MTAPATVVDTVAQIRQRLELIRTLCDEPTYHYSSNAAERRWVLDVTTLLAEIDRLEAAHSENDPAEQ